MGFQEGDLPFDTFHNLAFSPALAFFFSGLGLGTSLFPPVHKRALPLLVLLSTFSSFILFFLLFPFNSLSLSHSSCNGSEMQETVHTTLVFTSFSSSSDTLFATLPTRGRHWRISRSCWESRRTTSAQGKVMDDSVTERCEYIKKRKGKELQHWMDIGRMVSLLLLLLR